LYNIAHFWPEMLANGCLKSIRSLLSSHPTKAFDHRSETEEMALPLLSWQPSIHKRSKHEIAAVNDV
jgi:hypothetical protein